MQIRSYRFLVQNSFMVSRCALNDVPTACSSLWDVASAYLSDFTLCHALPCSLLSSHPAIFLLFDSHSHPRSFALAVPAAWCALSPELASAVSFSSVRPWHKCHFLREAFSNLPVQRSPLLPFLGPLFISLLWFFTIWFFFSFSLY